MAKQVEQFNRVARRRAGTAPYLPWLPGLLQFMAVAAFEAVTRSEFGAALIIFPNLVITGLRWLSAQTFLLKNGSLGIAIQLQKMRFLVSVPSVG